MSTPYKDYYNLVEIRLPQTFFALNQIQCWKCLQLGDTEQKMCLEVYLKEIIIIWLFQRHVVHTYWLNLMSMFYPLHVPMYKYIVYYCYILLNQDHTISPAWKIDNFGNCIFLETQIQICSYMYTQTINFSFVFLQKFWC